MNGVLTEKIQHSRDYDYEKVCGAVDGDFPEYFEIPKENTGTQKDQGDVGACCAEVITSIAEEWYRQELGEQEEHSEGFAYGALRSETSINTGMFVSKAMEFWVSIGSISKKYFDKLIEMPKLKELIKKIPNLYERASKYKLKAFVNLNYADKTKRDKAIKNALTKYKYGLVAVSDDYFRGGSHCIQLTGWNDKNDKYIFKNSWGANWGNNGYGTIPKSEINAIYLPIFENISLPFTDVKETDWNYKDIKNMYFNGLINGTSDATFEPEKGITRGEAAALFNRVLKEMDNRFDIVNKLLNEIK